jgi:peroxiredoxin (alkyl hydroperoxide reductase subunit C)
MALIDSYEAVSMPRIGDRAPGFRAVTTQGSIYFPCEYSGKWVILFNHPEDFILSESIENIAISSLVKEFKDFDCELIGLTVDGFSSAVECLRTNSEKTTGKGFIKPEINFPVILDTDVNVSRAYGMLQHDESNINTERAIFFIDPLAIIRGIIHYPVSIGFSLEELRRVIIALQTAEMLQDFMPSGWIPGDTQMTMSGEWPQTTLNSAVERNQGAQSCDCFFCASA